jgi:peptidoglycan/LPS O-acetylase OafA/YrhL
MRRGIPVALGDGSGKSEEGRSQLLGLGILAAQTLLLAFKPAGYLLAMEVLMPALPLVTICDPEGLVGRLLETALVAWIGRISYSLYLWQQLFLQSAIPQRVIGPIPGLLVNFASPFVPAVISYYFVERPLIRMGRRLERRLEHRRSSLQAAGATL